MRVRIVQAFAIVALLHTITPHLDPARVELGALDHHYGETVQLEGRVVEVDPAGEVVRLALASEGTRATVLTRGQPPSMGAEVVVRGQPSPGEHGPIVWAEGPIEPRGEGPGEDALALARVLDEAPQLAGRPIAVAGDWPEEGHALVSPDGRLPVDAAGIEPEPGPVVAWGRLTYEPDRAGYELEATGWRPWSPPAP